MKHTCHWNGCTKEVPPKMWGCSKHWFMLPKHYRDRIWKHYRPGQEVDKNPSREYVTVVNEVSVWIALQARETPDLIPQPLESKRLGLT